MFQYRVADATGSIQFAAWGAVGAAIKPGDILRLTGGYATRYRGRLTLNRGHQGRVIKEGVTSTNTDRIGLVFRDTEEGRRASMCLDHGWHR